MNSISVIKKIQIFLVFSIVLLLVFGCVKRKSIKQLNIDIARKDVCCTSIKNITFGNITNKQRYSFNVDEKSLIFSFGGKKSYIKAIDIRSIGKVEKLYIRSMVHYLNEFDQAEMFTPAITFLDKSKSILDTKIDLPLKKVTINGLIHFHATANIPKKTEYILFSSSNATVKPLFATLDGIGVRHIKNSPVGYLKISFDSNEEKYLRSPNDVSPEQIEASIEEQTNLAGYNLVNYIYKGQYEAAISYIEKLSSIVSADITKENFIVLELNHIQNTKKDLSNNIAALVDKYPNNVYSYLIRGYYLTSLAGKARGKKWIHLTSEEQLKNMSNIQKKAILDFEKINQFDNSIKYLAHIQLGNIYKTRRTDATLSGFHFIKAFKLQPSSYWVWAEKLSAITPRWGGSYELMTTSMKEMAPYIYTNSNLKVLQNSILLDQGQLAEYNEKYVDAKNIYTKALKYGKDHRVLSGLAYVNKQLGKYKEGCSQILEAIKQRPYISEYNTNYLLCK